MNAERLLDGFNLLGDGPETVQQLRKLVIGLAISGKLIVAGEETIEPTDLLRLIEARKRALIQQGVLRRQNPLANVTADDLPSGFASPAHFVRLGSIASIEKGLTGIMKAEAGPYPLVVTAEDRASCNHFDFDGTAAIVPLVSSAGHGKASLQRLHYQDGKFALGSILAAIFPHAPELISARFLFEYLTVFKEELLVSQMIGTANVSLSIGKVSNVPVPLISPSIQRKVDELMTLCDQLEASRKVREAVRHRLATASLARLDAPGSETFEADARFALNALPTLTTRPDQIKQFRQTVLKLAMRGKLVPQDPSDEPASELLKRIAREKAQLVKEGKADRRELLPTLDLAHAPFGLPAGWAWARFPELGTFGRGKSKHRPRNDPALFDGGEHLMIQTGDVARSQGVIETYRSKYNDFGLAQSYKWPKGTLCITIAANIADSGILSFDACFPDSIVGFNPASMFEDARYFEYFIRTAKANLLEFAPATAQKNINLEILKQVLIPLPPIAEQRRIVAKVDELMALFNRLEASLVKTAAARRDLLEALLAQALVPIADCQREAAE